MTWGIALFFLLISLLDFPARFGFRRIGARDRSSWD